LRRRPMPEPTLVSRWFGERTPATLGDTKAEYAVLREGAALLDLSPVGKLRVTGDDRLTYLQGQLSQDVQPLARTGTGTYACLLKPTGQMLSDLMLFSLPDAIILLTPPTTCHLVRERLEQFIIMEEVEITDVTHDYHLFHLTGAVADRVLQAVALEARIALWHSTTIRWREHSLVLLCTDCRSERGYDLLVPEQIAGEVWQALQRAGGQPIGYQAWNVHRVEAGIPLFGLDMDDNTIPLEAGLGQRAISFTKGCYTGQEVIHRIYSRGHTNRSLVGLRLFEDRLPTWHAAIHVAQRSNAGWITSAVYSFALETGIALGYLRNEYIAPGTAVQVQHEEALLTAEVVSLPFVERCRA